jgi:hypothetical protein
MNDEKREELAQLFREAGRAHHEAFIDKDGADPDWPIWYAEFLHHRLNEPLRDQFTKSELVCLLIDLDQEIRRQPPGADWATYYANVLLERFGQA